MADFFQQQDQARRKTGLLLVYFALAVAALAAAVYVALFGILTLAAGSGDEPPPEFWDPALIAGTLIGVAGVVGLGSLFKTAQLASGGKVVALSLGGAEVLGNTREPRERRLLNIVEEMAIASGVPTPAVYVLPQEAGINAFAAGFSPGDAVVAVSQGSLEYLSRDELQGVVAHEFSHILNGDMRLNIRLMGLIFGILALSLLGRVLLELAGRGSYHRSSSSDDGDSKGDPRAFFVLLGLALFVLGYIGVFFGRLIQAAVSRQREFLADASAVQFTRNPDGIAGALKKIGGLAAGSRMTNPESEEASHMFFSDGFLGMRMTSLLASHPPLAERIRRIDPSFDGRYPDVTAPVAVDLREEPKTAKRGRPSIPGMPAIPGMPWGPDGVLPTAAIAAEEAANHVGRVTAEVVEYADALQEDLPTQLHEAAAEPFAARALVYCLLFDRRAEVRRVQTQRLEKVTEIEVLAEAAKLQRAVAALPDAERLPLVELTIPALRQMSPAQHRRFREQVAALVDDDAHLSVFEYALQCVLARHLDDAFGVRPAPPTPGTEGLGLELAQVLSLLAWEGAEDASDAEQAFQAAMAKCFPGRTPPPILPRAKCSLAEFDLALRRMALAAPDVKKRVVIACAACILADQQVAVREFELLRAVSAVLGCPMPPLPKA